MKKVIVISPFSKNELSVLLWASDCVWPNNGLQGIADAKCKEALKKKGFAFASQQDWAFFKIEIKLVSKVTTMQFGNIEKLCCEINLDLKVLPSFFPIEIYKNSKKDSKIFDHPPQIDAIFERLLEEMIEEEPEKIVKEIRKFFHSWGDNWAVFFKASSKKVEQKLLEVFATLQNEKKINGLQVESQGDIIRFIFSSSLPLLELRKVIEGACSEEGCQTDLRCFSDTKRYLIYEIR